MNIGWPEGIWIGIMIFGLISAATLDGQPKKENYSFPVRFVSSLIGFGLLYWGGFFK